MNQQQQQKQEHQQQQQLSWTSILTLTLTKSNLFFLYCVAVIVVTAEGFGIQKQRGNQRRPKSITKISSPGSMKVLDFETLRSRSTRIEERRKDDGDDDDDDDGTIPTMDWLTSSDLMRNSGTAGSFKDDDDGNIDFVSIPMNEDGVDDARNNDSEERFVPNEANPIPSTGVSVADEMLIAQRDRYYSEVIPISGLPDGTFAAQIASSTTAGSYEAVRYLIRLTTPSSPEEVRIDQDVENSVSHEEEKDEDDVFVMIDVPPFSSQLLQDIRRTMKENISSKKSNNSSTVGRLAAILITSEDAIHANDDDNDDPAGVYSGATDSGSRRTRQESDIVQWMKAFPEAAVIANRMDVPRYCRDAFTQRLDGYGPWASTMTDASKTSNDEQQQPHDELFRFIETGRPLVRKEWDPDTAKAVMSGKMKPPEVEVDPKAEANYSPKAIRSREEGRHVLAIYTPGRTYGSMSYVFPNLKLCACGYTVPLEDAREESNVYIDQPGPALDFRGYITTCKAGVSRQMDSARNLANGYSDRFKILLPSRGDPFFLNDNLKDRKRTLTDIIDQYDKLGRVYEELGIL